MHTLNACRLYTIYRLKSLKVLNYQKVSEKVCFLGRRYALIVHMHAHCMHVMGTPLQLVGIRMARGWPHACAR
jgi:hypothetical protein